MAEAVATVGGGELGAWLSEGVPAALLAGEELPPRPAQTTGLGQAESLTLTALSAPSAQIPRSRHEITLLGGS